jgi:hypothetical protein
MITKKLAGGVPIKQIARELPEGYTYTALAQWIYSNKIRNDGWKAVYAARNHCNECEFCHEFDNVMGTKDKSHLICTKSWRVIGASVVHCPVWCEKENEYGQDLRKL